jgi:hypothetical protein
MNGILVIPSYHRADYMVKRICVLSRVSPKWVPNTRVLVRENELVDYRKVVDKFGVELDVIPSDYYETREFGPSHTRDFIINRYCPKYDRLTIMDDDTILAYRPDLNISQWVNQTPAHFNDMMDRLQETTITFPLASIRARFGSQTKTTEKSINDRLLQVFSFHSQFMLDNHQVRFSNGAPFYISDIFFSLRTLQSGIRNVVYNRYTRDEPPALEGGCTALGRNKEQHTKCAFQVRDAFPDLVTLRSKTSPLWPGPSIGLTVDWKHAFKERT